MKTSFLTLWAFPEDFWDAHKWYQISSSEYRGRKKKTGWELAYPSWSTLSCPPQVFVRSQLLSSAHNQTFISLDERNIKSILKPQQPRRCNQWSCNFILTSEMNSPWKIPQVSRLLKTKVVLYKNSGLRVLRQKYRGQALEYLQWGGGGPWTMNSRGESQYCLCEVLGSRWDSWLSFPSHPPNPPSSPDTEIPFAVMPTALCFCWFCSHRKLEFWWQMEAVPPPPPSLQIQDLLLEFLQLFPTCWREAAFLEPKGKHRVVPPFHHHPPSQGRGGGAPHSPRASWGGEGEGGQTWTELANTRNR